MSSSSVLPVPVGWPTMLACYCRLSSASGLQRQAVNVLEDDVLPALEYHFRRRAEICVPIVLLKVSVPSNNFFCLNYHSDLAIYYYGVLIDFVLFWFNLYCRMIHL
jgi:hypothetical protein